MAILNTMIGKTETSLYTVGVGETSAMLSMIFCNNSSSAVIIHVYAYPSGGSASNTTKIISTYSIPAYDSLIWTANEKLILEAGSVISAVASTEAVVSCLVNYMLI